VVLQYFSFYLQIGPKQKPNITYRVPDVTVLTLCGINEGKTINVPVDFSTFIPVIHKLPSS